MKWLNEREDEKEWNNNKKNLRELLKESMNEWKECKKRKRKNEIMREREKMNEVKLEKREELIGKNKNIFKKQKSNKSDTLNIPWEGNQPKRKKKKTPRMDIKYNKLSHFNKEKRTRNECG